MYEVDEQDRVVELGDLPRSCTGAPLPAVIADENHLYVVYIVEELDSSWDGRSVRVVTSESDGEVVAVVQFSRPSAHFFGPPNDEAFEGHPLAGRGLRPYSAFEIENSSWVRNMEQRNRVHPQHSPSSYHDRRHFVLAFHDSTFECVARGYKSQIFRGSAAGTLQTVLGALK